MRFKLNRTQLEGLLVLIQNGLEITPEDTMADKLIKALMRSIAERLSKKVEKVRMDVKQPKSFTMNDNESMTLYCWYNMMRVDLESDYQYEVIVTDQIFNLIDQHYA